MAGKNYKKLPAIYSLVPPNYPMKKIYTQVRLTAFAMLTALAPLFSHAQSTFDIEAGPDDINIIKTIALPGNGIGVLSWDPTNTNVLLKIYGAAGLLKTNADITHLIDWPHTYHTSVHMNAIATAEGNIFISYSVSSNSAGMQTYNGRYIMVNNLGALLASGQINSVDAGSSYTWSIFLDRLSDGKILAVWRRSHNDNMVFRLFNPNGTPFNNDVAFAGVGTGDAQNVLYTMHAAAGRNGNFMISLFYWTGNLRGYVFDNNGNGAYVGGGRAFDIDPTITSNYGNAGLMALANGNFAACWNRSGQNYVKVLSNNGSTIVAEKNFETGFSGMFPVYTAGQEGFYTTTTVKLVPGNSDPYATVSLKRYDQDANEVSTTAFAGGYLIHPSFQFTPGISGGTICVYSYYKAFTSMPFPMNMSIPSGDKDAKATTTDFALSTLPVQLLSFDAKRITDTKVLLTWKTAAETNNSHFQVERSTNGTNFTPIGRVNAAPAASTVNNYNFSDADSRGDNIFYRLIQYDHDGRSKDLGTRLVRNTRVAIAASVYPNPVNGNTVTVLAGDQTLPIPYRIADAQGRTVANGTIIQAKQAVSVDGLKSGIYFLQLGAQTISIKK